MAIVTLRYWAAAKAAAGVAEDTVSATTLAAALAAGLAAVRSRADAGRESAGSAVAPSAAADPSPERPDAAGAGRPVSDHAEKFRLVLASSSFLIDGDPVGTRRPESVTLADAAVIEVLPPFAGG
jgi:molybdopterin converting factor small subunit